MNPDDPRLVHLTLSYLDSHRWVELHPLTPDEQPQLPFDGPQFHVVLAYPAQEVDPLAARPPARFEGDVHTEMPTLLIAPLCEPCLATEGAMYATGLGLRDVEGATRIVPVCGHHPEVRPTVPLEHLSEWTGHQVLWGELTDPFVGDVLTLSDHVRGVHRSRVQVNRTYAHELGRGRTAAVFADHLRVDDDGQLWLPTWARTIPGLPGTDVPLRRTDDGALVVDLDGVQLGRPLRRLPADRGAFVLAVEHAGEPSPPNGHDAWVEAGPDMTTR